MIGSGLYEIGGFPLPFFFLGSLMLSSAAISICTFLRRPKIGERKKGNEQQRERELKEQQRDDWRGILAIPELWLTSWAILTMEISCFFYDASLAVHLADASQGKTAKNEEGGGRRIWPY
jgi:hypothetical protein